MSVVTYLQSRLQNLHYPWGHLENNRLHQHQNVLQEFLGAFWLCKRQFLKKCSHHHQAPRRGDEVCLSMSALISTVTDPGGGALPMLLSGTRLIRLSRVLLPQVQKHQCYSRKQVKSDPANTLTPLLSSSS